MKNGLAGEGKLFQCPGATLGSNPGTTAAGAGGGTPTV